jgi:hypothetical protein
MVGLVYYMPQGFCGGSGIEDVVVYQFQPGLKQRNKYFFNTGMHLEKNEYK